MVQSFLCALCNQVVSLFPGKPKLVHQLCGRPCAFRHIHIERIPQRQGVRSHFFQFVCSQIARLLPHRCHCVCNVFKTFPVIAVIDILHNLLILSGLFLCRPGCSAEIIQCTFGRVCLTDAVGQPGYHCRSYGRHCRSYGLNARRKRPAETAHCLFEF